MGRNLTAAILSCGLLLSAASASDCGRASTGLVPLNLSVGMAYTTQQFSAFRQLAHRDSESASCCSSRCWGVRTPTIEGPGMLPAVRVAGRQVEWGRVLCILLPDRPNAASRRR